MQTDTDKTVSSFSSSLHSSVLPDSTKNTGQYVYRQTNESSEYIQQSIFDVVLEYSFLSLCYKWRSSYRRPCFSSQDNLSCSLRLFHLVLCAVHLVHSVPSHSVLNSMRPELSLSQAIRPLVFCPELIWSQSLCSSIMSLVEKSLIQITTDTEIAALKYVTNAILSSI